jgi:DNA-binding transcriptional MerR regulator
MPPTRYRVDELAAKSGMSVEVLRSYQSRGLLPPPEHEGRVAWYGPHHLDRLRTISDLKDKGWSLRSIADALEPAPPAAPPRIPVPTPDDELFDLGGLAERTGVPVAVLRSWEASGIIHARHEAGGRNWFTTADVHATKALLSLLGTGVPMEEFMAVASVQLDAVRHVADGTFALFERYLRGPLLAKGLPAKVEAERLAGALRLLLQSVGTLVTYNFQRTILDVALEFLEEHGTKEERAALAREVRRHFELVPLPDGV